MFRKVRTQIAGLFLRETPNDWIYFTQDPAYKSKVALDKLQWAI